MNGIDHVDDYPDEPNEEPPPPRRPPPRDPPMTLSPATVAGISVGSVLFLLLLVAICIALVVIAVVLVFRLRQKARTGAGQQCGGTAGGFTGPRRPLPPVVLVTHDTMYEEIPDSPPQDQVNCMREECTGQQKVTPNSECMEAQGAGVGKIPKHDGNSPLYHTLEPEVHTANEEYSEGASDYMQPVSLKEVADGCRGLETVAEAT